MSQDLTHLDATGKATMVDVGAKDVTARIAVAETKVRINAELQAAIESDSVAKGNVLDVARLAGIMAAKKTDELIPLCHSLPLDCVHVRAKVLNGYVYIQAEARTTAKTGVEMEAYTAASVAALTIIDMGKAIDPAMIIESVRLVRKVGGRRGEITPYPTEFPDE